MRVLATHIWSLGVMGMTRMCRALRTPLKCGYIVLFTLFSLIAPGAMPEAQAGVLTMVICTGSTMTTVTVDADGNPVTAQHQMCDWSGQTTLDRAPAIDLLARTAHITAFMPKLTHASAALTQHRPDRTRPRGPPFLL